MTHVRRTAVGVAIVGAAALSFLAPATTAAFAGGSTTGIGASPSTATLSSLALRDSTGMQSFAFDPTNKVWIFAQTMGVSRVPGATHPNQQGDLILTKVSSRGVVMGSMFLTDFGHGVSIGAEPDGKTTDVWAEAVAKVKPDPDPNGVDGFGTRIAKFAWKNSEHITPHSDGVTLFNPLPRHYELTPSLDLKDGLIGIASWNGKALTSTQHVRFTYDIYSLDSFEHGRFRSLAHIKEPTVATQGLLQGWSLLDANGVLIYSGQSYSQTNEPPGDANAFAVDANGVILGNVAVTAGPALTDREPEGIDDISGNICLGLASGETGDHLANVFCQQSPY